MTKDTKLRDQLADLLDRNDIKCYRGIPCPHCDTVDQLEALIQKEVKEVEVDSIAALRTRIQIGKAKEYSPKEIIEDLLDAARNRLNQMSSLEDQWEEGKDDDEPACDHDWFRFQMREKWWIRCLKCSELKKAESPKEPEIREKRDKNT